LTTSKAITAQILTIGDELLRGDLVDTNAAWLAARLGQEGLEVVRIVSVGDGREAIMEAVRDASASAGTVVTSGGLGPTADDRTTDAVARVVGKPLIRNEAALTALQERFAAIGRQPTPNNEKQAFFPEDAVPLPNRWGTAPGFRLAIDGAMVYCLPGVPRELKGIFDESIAPHLRERVGCRPAVIRTLKIFGLGESEIDHRLSGLLQAVDVRGCQPSLHYRTCFPENHAILVVRPGATRGDEGRAVEVLDALEQGVCSRLGPHVFARDQETFSTAVVGALKSADATVALAESCSGGSASDLLTAAPGASEVFHLGLVAYADSIKEKLLGVPANLLREHGAVSSACVAQMANSVRALAGATYGLAISGIAGPGGGTEQKQVGTVYFALADSGGVQQLMRQFPFERDRVKTISAYVALWLVYRRLAGGGTV
jgi:nicotinamide-nucleotide amidase